MQKKSIPQYEPYIRQEYADVVYKQIMSGWLGPGKTTFAFEEKICEITGSKYCLSTTSGTTAIIIALLSLELKPESTVLFPAYTFLAGANAARFLGYKIKLVDIKPETLSMTPVADGDAIIFVNHNGYVGEDVAKIKSFGIPMIEDSSQALGIPGAGRTGDLGIFSFSVPKIVTCGQGGAIITDREDLYEKCKRIRDHGENWRKTRIHEHLGVNFKFNDILAAYGLAQLNILDELLEKRSEIWRLYQKDIKNMNCGWMAIHRTKNANKVIFDLKQENIEAVKYYRPVNHNPPYFDKITYPEAEKVYEECVYLPSSLNLTKNDVNRISHVLQ